jgi:hypothetical protein
MEMKSRLVSFNQRGRVILRVLGAAPFERSWFLFGALPLLPIGREFRLGEVQLFERVGAV